MQALTAFAPGTARLQILAGVLYGIAGARNCKSDYALNEELIRDGLDILTAAGDLPAMLAGDADIEPEESKAVQAALDSAP